jgi:hypothetical protein
MLYSQSVCLQWIQRIRFATVLCITGIWISPSLGAQTTFSPPQRKVDVRQYTWVEQCLAASYRVQDSIRSWGLTKDTTSRTPAHKLAPQTIAIARQCSERYPVASASLSDFMSLLKLYRYAERYDDVVTLLRRKLETVADSPQQRYTLLGLAANTVMRNGPEWYPLADSLHTQRMQLAQDPSLLDLYRDSVFIHSSTFYTGLRRQAKEQGDSIWNHWAAEKVVALAKQATSKELESSYYTKYGRFYVLEALEDLRATPLLDSLRKSTAAYLALQRANWQEASKSPLENFPVPIGTTVPSIQAQFWFGTEANASRPSRGKVALVVFLNAPAGADPDLSIQAWCFADCLDMIEAIKGLSQQYPQLEITLVGRTLGFFRELPPLSPAEEAKWMQWHLLDHEKISAALAVEETPFWHIDAPDSRRVDIETNTYAAYSNLRGEWKIRQFTAFLIDDAGIVIEATRSIGMFGGMVASRFDKNNAEKFAPLIEILLQRTSSSRQKAQ